MMAEDTRNSLNIQDMINAKRLNTF